MSDAPETKGSATSRALGVVAWIGGAAVGTYSGINLLIPLAGTGLVWWAGKRYLNETKKPILASLSVNAGHFLWLCIGLATLGATGLAQLGGDIIIYAVGLLWLFLRPGNGPIYLLGIFQIVAVGLIGSAFAETAVGTAAHKALLVHIIWRILAIVFLARLWLRLRSTKAPEQVNAP